MIIQRGERPRGWTSVPNQAIEDDSMSFRALGVLTYLLSRPEGWQTDSLRLASSHKEGRDAVRAALTELERGRYLVRTKVQGNRGRWSTVTFVYDLPVPEGFTPIHTVESAGDNPVDGLGTTPPPTPGKPTPENPALLTKLRTTRYPDSEVSNDGSAVSPGDNSDAAVAATPLQGSPSGRTGADVEPGLDASEAEAFAECQATAPGLQVFALRAHLWRVLGHQPSFTEVLTHLVRASWTASQQRQRLTIALVVADTAHHLATSALDAVDGAEDRSGFAAPPIAG